MNLSSSVKKIACFLLAVLMLLSTVGCVEDAPKKKKKKVVKKKVIVVTNNNETDNNKNDLVIEDDKDDDDDDDDEEYRPERPLPEVKNTEKYVEPVVPEFNYDYAALNITSDYVIVYGLDSWSGRYEGKNGGINGTPIALTNTANNRVSALDLKTYFKDNYNLNLEVVKDTDPKAAAAAKKILVGDTAFYKTSLSEQDFAVKVVGNNLVFEGGHFAMVEKAVKWFQTVEIKAGQVATLTGITTDFASTVTLDNGVTYNYVWGDEHDGNELFDADKWIQVPHKNYDDSDLANVFDDPYFNAVENGRMRLTADRYYDETNSLKGYATSGATQTSNDMLFRNGYVEFRARLPYARGAFPAIWSLSNGTDFDVNVSNYSVDDGYGVYKNHVWDIEFDLFESFADLDHMTTTIHKWYTTIEDYDDKAKTAKIILDFGNGEKVDVFDKLTDPNWNLNSAHYTCAYNIKYDYNWSHKFADIENLNNEYHTYAYLYTSDHVTVYIDGEKFLDFDWDPYYDYKDGVDPSRNNNGVGMNLWHYLIYDMMIYTPVAHSDEQPAEKIITPDDAPHNMYVDYVRIYQDLDDTSMALCYPAAQE